MPDILLNPELTVVKTRTLFLLLAYEEYHHIICNSQDEFLKLQAFLCDLLVEVMQVHAFLFNWLGHLMDVYAFNVTQDIVLKSAARF